MIGVCRQEWRAEWTHIVVVSSGKTLTRLLAAITWLLCTHPRPPSRRGAAEEAEQDCVSKKMPGQEV